MKKIIILHDNPEWIEPIKNQINSDEFIMESGFFDLQKEPENNIYYNRLSASSFTRNVLFETSKVNQYIKLNKMGIKTPRTIVCFGKNDIKNAAEKKAGVKSVYVVLAEYLKSLL